MSGSVPKLIALLAAGGSFAWASFAGASTAHAQTATLTPSSTTTNIKTSPLTAEQLAIEKEAARIRAFRVATGIDKPRAPDGIKPLSLYDGAPVQTTNAVHQVVKGDTLFSLSKRYHVSVRALKSVNGLTADTIQLGQTLRLPQPSVSDDSVRVSKLRIRVEPVPEKYAPDTDAIRDVGVPKANAPKHYAVAPGDTLSAIARRSCVDKNDLVTANDLLKPDQLRPGQMLNLPEGHCLPR